MVCSQPHLRNHGGSIPAGLVAELGDGVACCELVACVVRRHGRRLPVARFLQFHKPGAGGGERLRGADPERVPRHATGNARGRCALAFAVDEMLCAAA